MQVGGTTFKSGMVVVLAPTKVYVAFCGFLACLWKCACVCVCVCCFANLVGVCCKWIVGLIYIYVLKITFCINVILSCRLRRFGCWALGLFWFVPFLFF